MSGIEVKARTALVTGSSRGIGRGIALKLAGCGVGRIGVHYLRNREAAEETARLLRERERLEEEVEQLKSRKTLLPEAEYEAELERIFITLAKVNRSIKRGVQ